MGSPVSVPAALGQRPLAVRSSLYTGSRVAARNTPMLSSSHISAVITLSGETVSTVSEDIHHMQVPVAHPPLCSSVTSTPRQTTSQGGEEAGPHPAAVYCWLSCSATLCLSCLMKYQARFLLDAHTRTKSCRLILQPQNGFGEQLIYYEFQLFGKNTMTMVNSPMGMIPDI
ncbi:hypothetical protein FD755_015849 [Muntiacus reevesi]|uniref:Uncharacterized protein n=1 Tax=Muntiacus reevesi TaxID=9886 RepID=A0A5N3XG34_MUNRE|nr:hypothetical protein FD755_015849 [Muntiacus reevesi]